MTITEYKPEHYKDVLSIFDSNATSYFTPSDRDPFIEFISNLRSPFFVVLNRENAIACGGFWFPTEDTASLTWGMVHKGSHRQGYGSFLLKHRMDLIKKHDVQSVVCETSQLTSGFFEKHCFKIQAVEENGFGPGIDKVTMVFGDERPKQ